MSRVACWVLTRSGACCHFRRFSCVATYWRELIVWRTKACIRICAERLLLFAPSVSRFVWCSFWLNSLDICAVPSSSAWFYFYEKPAGALPFHIEEENRRFMYMGDKFLEGT